MQDPEVFDSTNLEIKRFHGTDRACGRLKCGCWIQTKISMCEIICLYIYIYICVYIYYICISVYLYNICVCIYIYVITYMILHIYPVCWIYEKHTRHWIMFTPENETVHKQYSCLEKINRDFKTYTKYSCFPGWTACKYKWDQGTKNPENLWTSW